MEKSERQRIITDLIERQEISTQSELVEALQALRLDVTQATVSRDINELGLIKVSGKEKRFKYAVKHLKISAEEQRMAILLKGVMISIENANNLVILKTFSGNAGTAGAVIDSLRLPNVMGTIAGDDTLLIITKDETSAIEIVEKIRGIK